MRMQVILDSSFSRPSSAALHGAERRESSGTGLWNLKSSQVKSSHLYCSRVAFTALVWY